MHRKGTRRMIAGAIACALLAAAFWTGRYFLLAQAAGRPGRAVYVTIPMGTSSNRIGELLAQKGVIASSFWFRVYLTFSGRAAALQAGRYRFSGRLTIPAVVRELTTGAVANETVEITIPEGFTVRQIAALLARGRICSLRAFMTAVRRGVYRYWFIRDIPHDPYIRDRLEGYLFPNTYDFLRGEPPAQIIGTMLAETARVLSPSVVRTARRERLTIAQVLTIASLIEREAKLASDRPLIASVIFNRLHRNPPMPLQMDASIEYALGRTTTDLTRTDLAVRSPYNTYTHIGLPPGPIANPGLASIEAALHPAHTGYYYYVARFDGSGGNYYARTYAGQLRNEARSQRNLARLERKRGGG